MCEPMTIMAGISMTSAAIGVGQQSKVAVAQEEARRKNLREAVRQANYQDAAIQLQDKQNFQDARAQMEDISIERIQASSSVRTAIGESNLEGRTMERVQRDVDNAYLGASVDVQRNYDTQYANAWADREQVRNSLISTVQGSAAVQQPSQLGGMLQIAGAGVSGAIAGNELSGIFGKLGGDPTKSAGSVISKTTQAR